MQISDILTIIGLVLGGGGLGAIVSLFIKARSDKRIAKATADQKENETQFKAEDHSDEHFDKVYNQLNKVIEDYNELSNEFIAYREQTTAREMQIREEYETALKELKDQMQSVYADLESLRMEVSCMRGLVCYDFNCPKRIKVNK